MEEKENGDCVRGRVVVVSVLEAGIARWWVLGVITDPFFLLVYL